MLVGATRLDCVLLATPLVALTMVTEPLVVCCVVRLACTDPASWAVPATTIWSAWLLAAEMSIPEHADGR